MLYRVNDIYAAIQGEGVQAGIPMVLIRLQGCGVGCPWCDTKETWRSEPAHQVASLDAALGTSPRWTEAATQEIAELARRLGRSLAWCLLTGGEPAEQNLGLLVASFHRQGFLVALETSGTAAGHLGSGVDHVTVSPKIGMPGGKEIRPDAVASADELKFVIGKENDIVIVDDFLSRYPIKPAADISLQPLSQSAKSTELCARAAMDRGWRLSLQLHKYIHER